MFILSFEKVLEENNATKDYRDSFSNYYIPNVEVKDFNILTDGKSFLIPVKINEETYDEIIDMSKNNDYIFGNLLDYKYFLKYYKLIAINLSTQIELKNPDFKQQINFIGKLEEDNGGKMFFIIEKSEETTIEFSQNSVNII